MVGRSRPVRSVAPILANGLFAGAWVWTGLNIRKADMRLLSAMPSARAKESGRAATSNRGSIAPVSARAGGRRAAQTTQELTPDGLRRKSRNNHHMQHLRASRRGTLMLDE